MPGASPYVPVASSPCSRTGQLLPEATAAAEQTAARPLDIVGLVKVRMPLPAGHEATFRDSLVSELAAP